MNRPQPAVWCTATWRTAVCVAIAIVLSGCAAQNAFKEGRQLMAEDKAVAKAPVSPKASTPRKR